MTELVQRLSRVDVTSEDEGVGAPGANLVVTFFNVERQLARVASALRSFKNEAQVELIPEGMRGFAALLVP